MTDSSLFFFGNAGGTCKTFEHVAQLAARASVTHIEVGSITVLERFGNEGNIHWIRADGTSVNALGMPNRGYDYYEKFLPAMVELAHQAGKKLGVNIAAIHQGDTEKLCELCVKAGVDFITFNGGCPNVWAEGKQKLMVARDPLGLEREVSTVTSIVPASIRIYVKLTTYEQEFALRGEVASVLRNCHVGLITTNTKTGTNLAREDGKPAISFRSDGQEINVGGMGGTALRPYAKQELREFQMLLPYHEIISVGGVSSGQDVATRLNMGAQGVQVGTAYYFTDDPRVFGNILEQYTDIIQPN